MVPLPGDFAGVPRLSGTISDRSALSVQLHTGTYKRIQHHHLPSEERSYLCSLQMSALRLSLNLQQSSGFSLLRARLRDGGHHHNWPFEHSPLAMLTLLSHQRTAIKE